MISTATCYVHTTCGRARQPGTVSTFVFRKCSTTPDPSGPASVPPLAAGRKSNGHAEIRRMADATQHAFRKRLTAGRGPRKPFCRLLDAVFDNRPPAMRKTVCGEPSGGRKSNSGPKKRLAARQCIRRFAPATCAGAERAAAVLSFSGELFDQRASNKLDNASCNGGMIAEVPCQSHCHHYVGFAVVLWLAVCYIDWFVLGLKMSSALGDWPM